jgi:predicted esterase
MSATETLLIPARVHGRVLVRRAPPPVHGVLAGFHGYGEDAAIQLERLERMTDPAWTLVAVQALNRFYRGRSRETIAGWMTRDDRLAAIADNIAYVDAALDAVHAEAGQPIVVLTGFSQGVAMAFRAAVRGRRPASAVIAVGGDVPPELLEDPSALFPEVLLVRGERDEWYTAAKMAHDTAALIARGVHVRTEVVEGGHEWLPAVSVLAGRFLAELGRSR